MSYNFLSNVQIEETPLLSSSELLALENQPDPKEQEEEGKEPLGQDENSSGLLPLELLEEDPEEQQSQPKQEEDKSKDTSKAKEANSKKPIYQAFVEDFLKSNGIDPEELELGEIKTAEQAREVIANLYSNEVTEQVESYKNEFLSPLQKKFVDLVEKGVSSEDAASLMVSHKTLEGITEEKIYEDMDTAKKLFAEYLRKTTKFSEAKILKEVEMKVEAGVIQDDAKEALPELKQILGDEEKALLQEQQNKAKEAQDKTLKAAQELNDYLEATEKIGGFDLNTTLKTKWKKEYGLVEVDTPEGKKKVQPIQATRMANPTEFDALMRLYHSLGLFKFDARKKTFTPDFSALTSLGKKEVISDFQKALEREGDKNKFRDGTNTELEMDGSKEAEMEKWKDFAKKYKNQ